MRIWTTTATVGAEPGAVLNPTAGSAAGARHEAEPVRRWAPVDFRLGANALDTAVSRIGREALPCS